MLQVLEALNVFDPADVDNAVTALDEEVCTCSHWSSLHFGRNRTCEISQ
jgi:hypothetical protein